MSGKYATTATHFTHFIDGEYDAVWLGDWIRFYNGGPVQLRARDATTFAVGKVEIIDGRAGFYIPKPKGLPTPIPFSELKLVVRYEDDMVFAAGTAEQLEELGDEFSWENGYAIEPVWKVKQ